MVRHCCGLLLLYVCLLTTARSVSATESQELIKRGEYLAAAADCQGCHSAPGRPAYAGGREFKTPFGSLYSPNITPDAATGIGRWSDEEFQRAMRKGLGKKGEHLYPAFPYPWFARLTTEDVLAIKSYLFSLPPVVEPRLSNELRFPFNVRALMGIWNALFVRPEAAPKSRAVDPIYERGRYLAEALGHCDECHTPRNSLAALKAGEHLSGGHVDDWDAYNITPDMRHGIGAWSLEDISTYLASGHLDDRAVARGPMAEVVSYSTRHLTPDDRHAIAVYLKSQPPLTGRDAPSQAREPAIDNRTQNNAPLDGDGLYQSACASCHGSSGEGLSASISHESIPGLRASAMYKQGRINNLILTLLQGVERDGAKGEVFMPPFGTSNTLSNALDDQEIAILGNFISRQFGSMPAHIRSIDVHRLAAGRTGTSGIALALLLAGFLVLMILLIITGRSLAKSRRAPRPLR